jgi:hypothetical protein
MYLVAHIKPKAKGWEHMAYPAIARAAAMMRKGSDSRFIKTKVDADDAELSQLSSRMTQPSVDPYLKAELDSLLGWIKDPQGLPYYLDYSLQENDPYKISRLAEIYSELYRIFYS